MSDKIKRGARARQAATGEPYTRARRAADRQARRCLAGPVPDWTLSTCAEGEFAREPGGIVPGTPAVLVWDAVGRLEAYVADREARSGDSPADLAAALDGLTELLSRFTAASSQLLQEIPAGPTAAPSSASTPSSSQPRARN